jgi:hypothetical protein
MTLKAKELLKGKFWIVENDTTNERVGVLSTTEDHDFVYSCHEGTTFFKNVKQLKNTLGTDINWVGAEEKSEEVPFEIYNFPTSCRPYNEMYDVKRKLPLFTKSNKSKSLYCAGYYVIRFDKGWVKSFCPKLITIERYESHGPFKTELEMRQELSRVNAKK